VFTHFNANFTPVIARECPADIDCSAGSWFTKQDCLRLALPAPIKKRIQSESFASYFSPGQT
jgi:hypothetical protein